MAGRRLHAAVHRAMPRDGDRLRAGRPRLRTSCPSHKIEDSCVSITPSREAKRRLCARAGNTVRCTRARDGLRRAGGGGPPNQPIGNSGVSSDRRLRTDEKYLTDTGAAGREITDVTTRRSSAAQQGRHGTSRVHGIFSSSHVREDTTRSDRGRREYPRATIPKNIKAWGISRSLTRKRLPTYVPDAIDLLQDLHDARLRKARATCDHDGHDDGARVESRSTRRDNDRATSSWKGTPAGRGRPGTTCRRRPAGMAHRVLGDGAAACSARRSDVHFGGVDLDSSRITRTKSRRARWRPAEAVLALLSPRRITDTSTIAKMSSRWDT